MVGYRTELEAAGCEAEFATQVEFDWIYDRIPKFWGPRILPVAIEQWADRILRSFATVAAREQASLSAELTAAKMA